MRFKEPHNTRVHLLFRSGKLSEVDYRFVATSVHPKVGWRAQGKINVFIISILSSFHCHSITYYLQMLIYDLPILIPRYRLRPTSFSKQLDTTMLHSPEKSCRTAHWQNHVPCEASLKAFNSQHKCKEAMLHMGRMFKNLYKLATGLQTNPAKQNEIVFIFMTLLI